MKELLFWNPTFEKNELRRVQNNCLHFQISPIDLDGRSIGCICHFSWNKFLLCQLLLNYIWKICEKDGWLFATHYFTNSIWVVKRQNRMYISLTYHEFISASAFFFEWHSFFMFLEIFSFGRLQIEPCIGKRFDMW